MPTAQLGVESEAKPVGQVGAQRLAACAFAPVDATKEMRETPATRAARRAEGPKECDMRMGYGQESLLR